MIIYIHNLLLTGQVGMMILRCTKNALAPPMIVNVDVRPKIFAYSTRFRVKVLDHYHIVHLSVMATRISIPDEV